MSAATQPQLAGCESVGLALVHHSARGIYRRSVYRCHTCERRTPFVVRHDGAWYGVTFFCTICLDYWADGERAPRPFQRYWRRERSAYIKEMWDDAMLPDHWRAWTRWDMHRATCDVEGDCAECETRPS